jgi:sugar porter (SP) family MFS transporter
MGFNFLSLGVVFTTSCGFLLFGYDQGVLGGLIENENFQVTFNRPSQMVIGQITATYDLGCFFGAIICMAGGDRIGRRLSIASGCLLLTLGAVVQTASFSVAQMVVGRFVAGLGNGINTTAIPVWQSEMSKPRHRGPLAVLHLALNQLGNVTAQWLNFGLGYIGHQSVSWRFPIAFQIFYAVVTIVLLPWLPDSPRWLIQKGRFEEAKAVAARLHDKDINDPELVALHEASIQHIQHEVEVSKVSWRSLSQSDSLRTRRRVILGMGAQFMQQWGGINAINYYLPVVFSSLRVSRRMSLVLSGCNAINLMVFTTAAITVIEKAGRKRLMLWGALGQGTCFVLLTFGLAIGESKWSAVAIAFVFAFYTVFGLTWIAIPWMYAAEVNTQPWRNRGAGLATATNWICNYAVVLVTPIGVENIKWRYYIIYAVLNFCFIPVVSLWYVETAGLSLEEIDAVFQKQNDCLPPDMLKSGVKADQGKAEWDQGQSEWVESIDLRRQDRGSVGDIRPS